MKFEEAKNLVKSLLEGVGVYSVYYIDDYLSFDGLQSIMAYIEDESKEELLKHASLLPESLIDTKDFDPDIRERIQSWWHTLSNKKRQEIIKECLPEKSTYAEWQIKQLFGKTCVMCSPDQWDTVYSKECLNRIKKGEKVLLLFDQKLGTSDASVGEGRTGLSMAQFFCGNVGVKENSYCGIFSQSFEREEELKFRNEKIKELSSWAFPLSKKRMPVDDDYTLFVEGINNLLWVGYVDNLSEMTQKLIEQTSKKIMSEFGKILPLELKQIVIDSSHKEGCREIDTLLRLVHIIFERELQGALASTEGGLKAFNENIKSIKDIDSIVSNKVEKNLQGRRYNAAVVNKFFQDEIFVSGTVINQLLMPLQNGDVFSVNDSSYYILLCQPCTISLRKGGKRGGNGIGYFVPLEESKEEKSIENALSDVLSKNGDAREKAKEKLLNSIQKKLQTAAQGYSYAIKCSIENKKLCASVNKYTTISLSLLDFCTFSEDGHVIINKEISPNLHPNQKLLNENHTKYFKEVLDLDRFVEGLSEDCHIIVKQKVEGWFYAFLTKLGIKPKFENNRYIFPIKRCGRIQDPLASDLLTQLSHYISRAGLPNEFDR